MIEVTKQRDLEVMVFDFETKPGAYWYDDTTTTLVCAFAAKFIGESKVYRYFMVPDWLWAWSASTSLQEIRTRKAGMAIFSEMWRRADVVVTHNGKRFDLPVINGALDRLGMVPLAPKTHVDTLADRIKSRGVKRSLEALAERYELPDEKLGVSSETWERAYEFEPAAIKTVLERAASDVELTEQLYIESIKRGVLR